MFNRHLRNCYTFVTEIFPGGSDGKESACNAGNLGLIPGSGRFPWRREWQPTPVILAWRIPWTEEPGGLQSVGSQRVGHDWLMHTVLSLLMGIPHECELLVTQEVQLGSEKTQLGLGFQGKLKKRNRWNSVMANRTPSQAALVVKDLPANAGDTRDMGSTPGLGRSPEGGHDNPLQYSCLENPMDRGAWRATVHRVTKNWTKLK